MHNGYRDKTSSHTSVSAFFTKSEVIISKPFTLALLAERVKPVRDRP
jgi:hypothetical protein